MTTNSIDLMVHDLRPADADCVDEWLTPAQHAALMREITTAARPAKSATGRRRHPRRASLPRRVLAPAVTAAVAAGAVVMVVLGSGGPGRPAQAVVAFHNARDGEIVATVTNPFAAKKQLDAAFAAHGLHVSVNLLPVSPSIVGTVIYTSDGGDDGIQPLQGGRCLTGGGGCPIGLRIPTSFSGQGDVTLGRPAKKGESYESTASAFAPGETLHCSGLHGAQVGAAASVLRARHLTVGQWRVADEVVSTAPADNYVWEIDPVTASTVRVWTKATPPPTTAASAAYKAGCGRTR